MVIIGFDDGKLIAHDRNTGPRRMWETTVSLPRGRTEVERLVDLDAQLCDTWWRHLRGFIPGSPCRGAGAFNGDVLWSRESSPAFQAIAIDDNALYLSARRQRYLVDRPPHGFRVLETGRVACAQDNRTGACLVTSWWSPTIEGLFALVLRNRTANCWAGFAVLQSAITCSHRCGKNSVSHAGSASDFLSSICYTELMIPCYRLDWTPQRGQVHVVQCVDAHSGCDCRQRARA